MPASDPMIGWTAVVLAAGRGRRMGGPKALMRVVGREWWRLQEERLEHAGVHRVWVVSPAVRAQVRGLTTAEADPDAPMFASVLAGMRAAPGAGLFILPVDVPAPGPDVWRLLAAAADAGVAVPTSHGERGHPIALSRPWIDRVLSRAGHEDRLDHLIGPDVVEVPVADPGVLANLNTPGDVRAWAAANP